MSRCRLAVLFGCALSLLSIVYAGPARAAVPANDDFAQAMVLSGTSANVTVNTIGATTEPGEPTLAYAAGDTVWFAWTAPDSATYAISTFGSNYSTQLAVYTGTTVASLTKVISSGQVTDVSLVGADVPLTTVAGATYYLQVDGYNTGGFSTGSVALHLAPAQVSGHFTGASPDEPAQGCVTVEGTNGWPVSAGCTDSSGLFALSGVPAGSGYDLSFAAMVGGHWTRYYYLDPAQGGDMTSRASAAQITFYPGCAMGVDSVPSHLQSSLQWLGCAPCTAAKGAADLALRHLAYARNAVTSAGARVVTDQAALTTSRADQTTAEHDLRITERHARAALARARRAAHVHPSTQATMALHRARARGLKEVDDARRRLSKSSHVVARAEQQLQADTVALQAANSSVASASAIYASDVSAVSSACPPSLI